MKKIVLLFLIISLFAVSVSAFDFTGNAKDIEGNNVAGANVTLTELVMGLGTPQTFSALADSNGLFTVQVTNESISNFELSIINYSSDGITALLTNKILPAFPASMYNTSLAGQTFYLQNATTINITAGNQTHDFGQVAFRGFVMDSKYNFPIKTFVSSAVTQTLVVVPVGKSNYSISLFRIVPNTFYPKSQTFAAESTPAGVINHTEINVSSNPVYVYGYLLHENGSLVNLTKGENITKIRSYFKEGNFIDLDNGYMQGATDVITNVTDAVWYNITLLDGSRTFIVTIFANNSASTATYYAGFQNFSSLTAGTDVEYNITVYPLTGSYTTTEDFNTSHTTFNVYYNNSTDMVGAQQTFVQFKVYNYTGSEQFLTFTKNTNNSGQVKMFLRNDSAISVDLGIEVFNQQFPPRKFHYTNAQLAASEINLTLAGMNAMTDPDGNLLEDIQIEFFKSSSTCDVVGTPPTSCKIFEISNSSNPEDGVKVLLSPGDVSIRLTKSTTLGSIVTHYINVDMIASGPPEMKPSTSSTASDSGGSLKDIWKLGSMGPSAYESIIVGVPYNDTRMDDSYTSAPTILLDEIYDVQNSWNQLWNSTGDNTADEIAANFSAYPNDYSDYDIRWFNSSAGGMPCSFTNTSAKCYIDTANNMVWLRIAHFSGVGPQVRGYSGLGNISTDEGVYSCWQDSATTQGCSVLVNLTVNESSTWANENWNVTINNTATVSGIEYIMEWYNDSNAWTRQSDNNTFVNNSGDGFNLSVGTHQFRINITLSEAASTLWNLTFNVNNTIDYTYNVVWLDSINLTDPPARNITTDQTPLFNFTLFSENWTSQSCTLNIDSTTYTNSTVTNGTAALIIPTSNLAHGNYTYNITCNVTGTSANRWIYINDTTVPTFSTAPAASSITTSGATLTATTNEAATCRYSTSSSVGYSDMTAFGSTGGTTHSISLTGLTSSTGYTYYVKCQDTGSNLVSSSATFTTSSTGGGGGAGGSGGGISTGVTGQSAQRTWASINAGETATIAVANAEIGVTEVSFAVEDTTWGAWVKVQKIDTLPSTVESYSGKVYRNIKISENNVEKSLKGTATVKFKVAKSWLTENKIGQANVALLRFADDKWNELPTTVGEDDGTYVHYSAEALAFSYFVIGEKVGAPEVVAEEEAIAEEEAAAEEAAAEEAEEAAAEAAKKNVWLWVIPIVVALAVIIWLVKHKKKQ